MVIVLNPVVQTISGRLGKLVYYRNGRTQYARRYVVPRNPDTESQRTRRELFAAAVAVWQKLPIYKKEQWNRRALSRGISGYNLFISESLKQKNLSSFASAGLGSGSSIDHIRGLSVAPVSLTADTRYSPLSAAGYDSCSLWNPVPVPS